VSRWCLLLYVVEESEEEDDTRFRLWESTGDYANSIVQLDVEPSQ